MKKYIMPSMQVVTIVNKPLMAGSITQSIPTTVGTDDFTAGARRNGGWFDDEEDDE